MEDEGELLHRLPARKSFLCCLIELKANISLVSCPGEEELSGSDNDKEFEGVKEEDISLEDEDTDNEKREVEDLNEDIARKSSTTPTRTVPPSMYAHLNLPP